MYSESFMLNLPNGFEYRVKLRGNNGVSKAFQAVYTVFHAFRNARNAYRLVHPTRKPISHSTQSGFSSPPFPAAMLRRSSGVISPAASFAFSCW